MLAMQKLQPEMKRLQAEHKGDRQKLNEEMMKLYQEHKINPIGGACRSCSKHRCSSSSSGSCTSSPRLVRLKM
jgi:hypothetical protein